MLFFSSLFSIIIIHCRTELGCAQQTSVSRCSARPRAPTTTRWLATRWTACATARATLTPVLETLPPPACWQWVRRASATATASLDIAAFPLVCVRRMWEPQACACASRTRREAIASSALTCITMRRGRLARPAKVFFFLFFFFFFFFWKEIFFFGERLFSEAH